MKRDVKAIKDGVTVTFSTGVKKEQIIKMVQNCQSGACECMSQNSKEKIKDMQVEGKDGLVKLNLKGTITKSEIEEALAKSKVLNS